MVSPAQPQKEEQYLIYGSNIRKYIFGAVSKGRYLMEYSSTPTPYPSSEVFFRTVKHNLVGDFSRVRNIPLCWVARVTARLDRQIKSENRNSPNGSPTEVTIQNIKCTGLNIVNFRWCLRPARATSNVHKYLIRVNTLKLSKAHNLFTGGLFRFVLPF